MVISIDPLSYGIFLVWRPRHNARIDDVRLTNGTIVNADGQTMKPRLAREEATDDDVEESDDSDDLAAPLPEPPAVAYRVGGEDLERRADLEQEAGQLRDKVRALERELYSTRAALRKRNVRARAVSALRSAGYGSTGGAVIAALLYVSGAIQSADWVLLTTGLPMVLGFFIGGMWKSDSESDDDFPKAPPERLY